MKKKDNDIGGWLFVGVQLGLFISVFIGLLYLVVNT